MPRIYEAGWRRSHENTKWPFSESATLANNAGDEILQSIFLDAMLHPLGATNGLYVRDVNISADEAIISMGDESGTLCVATFDLQSPPSSVPVEDVYGRPAGVLVSESNRLLAFRSWSFGSHTFRRRQTEFVAEVVRPRPTDGLSAVLVGGDAHTGDVWLVGGRGVILQHETVEDRDENGELQEYEEIIIHAVGEPLRARESCYDVTGSDDGSEFDTPRFVKELRIYAGGRERSLAAAGDDKGAFLTINDINNQNPGLRISPTAEGLYIGYAKKLTGGNG